MEGFALNLAGHYGASKPALSFELFPPKTEQGMLSLFQHLEELARCNPAYITCTYGAGGSTQGRTLEVLQRVREAYPHIPVASHLTCVGATVGDLRGYIRQAIALHVEYIVALRGDPPKDQSSFVPVAGGLSFGNELVALIHREFPALGVIVGGYPEVHPEAVSPEVDLDMLKQKVDAGAHVVITQLFYDNGAFYRFRDRCVTAGIAVPIVPGVLPITKLSQIAPDKTMFGAQLPATLVERMYRFTDDAEGQFAVGVYSAARQVEDLVEHSVPGVHFYVLNHSRAAAHICRALAL
ncbi:MAG: methylenetetrahydrofolate reductase [NAD(P)H] [Candidatus Hydrogenedentes bacterium]|nr:methylenetetrahydrofolate reductase [NAD(P)H] [Candidatus Hydrogenedentota bacterium]